MEKLKLITLEGLKTFLTNLLAKIQVKLDDLDTKIELKVWQGTQAELPDAIAKGLIKEGYTTIIITDDEDTPQLSDCTYDDILALFIA